MLFVNMASARRRSQETECHVNYSNKMLTTMARVHLSTFESKHYPRGRSMRANSTIWQTNTAQKLPKNLAAGPNHDGIYKSWIKLMIPKERTFGYYIWQIKLQHSRTKIPLTPHKYILKENDESFSQTENNTFYSGYFSKIFWYRKQLAFSKWYFISEIGWYELGAFMLQETTWQRINNSVT